MFAEHETLVTGVDDDGVVHLPCFLKVLEKATQVVVDSLYAPEKFLEIGVVGKASVLFVGIVDRIVVLGEFIGKSFVAGRANRSGEGYGSQWKSRCEESIRRCFPEWLRIRNRNLFSIGFRVPELPCSAR